MVTELVEGGKLKADKFWPEKGEDDIKVVGDVNIKYKSTESKGNLTIREFTISQRDEAQRIVTLVQPELDLDLSKTRGSEQMFAIVRRTNALWRNHKAPLMVMCEDGSGRTGAFIAIYKLWVDLQDPDCSSLALLPTGKKYNWEICCCCSCCPKKMQKIDFSGIHLEINFFGLPEQEQSLLFLSFWATMGLLVFLGHFGPFCTIMDHWPFGAFGAIIDLFGQF